MSPTSVSKHAASILLSLFQKLLFSNFYNLFMLQLPSCLMNFLLSLLPLNLILFLNISNMYHSSVGGQCKKLNK